MSIYRSVLRTKEIIEGNGRKVHIKEIPDDDYERLGSIEVPRFVPSESGLFGIDERVIVLTEDWAQNGRVVAYKKEVKELARILKRRFTDKFPQCVEFQERGSEDVPNCSMEFRKGIFQSPWQEFKLDRILREAAEEEGNRLGLTLLYSGKEHLTGTRSYGHHVHWSAGNALDTFLLYIAMRNDLWRVTAFSANSPLLGPNDSMCIRLGSTHVEHLVPKHSCISEARISEIKYDFNRYGNHRYTMLIDKKTGTLEVRAADLDIMSTATDAYTILLLEALQRDTARTKTVPIYFDNLIKRNMKSAKKYAISDEGTVEIPLDGSIVEVPIKQEMIRHFEQVIEPLLEERTSNAPGRFIHKEVADEMRSRIYDGATPAQKQLDIYKRVLKKSTHKDALIAAQQANFAR